MKKFTIRSAKELVTSKAQTRAGFINMALAKNEKATPYVRQAKDLRNYAHTVSSPEELKNIPDILNSLLTAAGLSEKSLQYFNEQDKMSAVDELIQKYLLPAGDEFADELVYRFLMIKGDTLGGEMRNYVGRLAQTKLTTGILSILNSSASEYYILSKNSRSKSKWMKGDYSEDYKEAQHIKAIAWEKGDRERLLIFNCKIPLVDKNIDICLFKSSKEEFKSIASKPLQTIMLGELKGGIDPAGADEHWKTGNSALNRIRTAFSKINVPIATSFVAAAIAPNMAVEIWEQLQSGELTNAANLSVDSQMTMYCDWLTNL